MLLAHCSSLFTMSLGSSSWDQGEGKKATSANATCSCGAPWATGLGQRLIPDMLQGESGLSYCSSHLWVSPASPGTFHPPVSGPPPKWHGVMGGTGGTPSHRHGTALSKGTTTGCHIPPALLGPPPRETFLDQFQQDPLEPSSFLDVPASSAAAPCLKSLGFLSRKAARGALGRAV